MKKSAGKMQTATVHSIQHMSSSAPVLLAGPVPLPLVPCVSDPMSLPVSSTCKPARRVEFPLGAPRTCEEMAGPVPLPIVPCVPDPMPVPVPSTCTPARSVVFPLCAPRTREDISGFLSCPPRDPLVDQVLSALEKDHNLERTETIGDISVTFKMYDCDWLFFMSEDMFVQTVGAPEEALLGDRKEGEETSGAELEAFRLATWLVTVTKDKHLPVTTGVISMALHNSCRRSHTPQMVVPRVCCVVLPPGVSHGQRQLIKSA
jgi:hypothetical protein